MNYTIIEKPEWKNLIPIPLGGTDGTLYLSPDKEKILKLLFNYALYHGIEEKKILLKYLMTQNELNKIAAIPEELVFVPHKNKIGFWMAYLENGVRLDEWTKQNESHPRLVLKVYQRISETLKELHERYGIVVSDFYYTNIIIVDNEFPIFVDVDSWKIDGIESYTISNILQIYSRRQLWNRYNQATYLRSSKETDKVALWLMYFESVLGMPIRKFLFAKKAEKRSDIDPIIKEIIAMISKPELEAIPYLHETPHQYKLYK